MRTNLRLLSILICSFLVTALSAAVPFKTTTISNGEFAKGTVWYTMQIGANQFVISDNEGADRIKLTKVNSDLSAADLWCFVGNESTGYQIYNKQAGTGKVLASSTKMGNLSGYSGTGGSTYPTMQDVNSLPAGYVGSWDLKASDKLTDVEGYFVMLHNTQYAMNNFGNVGDLAFWAEGMDAGSTVTFQFAETVVEINQNNGTFTSSNSNKTWHAVWSSNELDGFTLSTGANNMTTENGYIAAFSGTANNCTHTLTAPEGCAVTAYSFDFKNYQNNSSYSETLTINGKTYKSSTETQHVDVKGLEERMATYTQSGANKGVTLSNYYVTIRRSFVEPEPQVDVFITRPGNIPYRIPAIARAQNGNLIAVADYRHSGADIGMSPYGRIDLHARISKDNGATWGEQFAIVLGQGRQSPDFMHVGFGDPCIVADRESSRVLVLSCAGNVSFPSGTNSNHQNIARFYSEDNGEKWTEPVDIAPQFYSQLDAGSRGPVMAMFIGSGKIMQSYTTKVGEYYRLYCAVLCKDKNANYTNYVFYSDDFGGNWTVLGGPDVPPVTSGGDEPKVEELPDGSILLSSRINGGRFYNIYTFTNSKTGEGSWGTTATSNSANKGVIAISNSTNGEVICLPVTRKEDNKDMFLLLQSVPFGSGRANVGIYYKELETLEDFISPANIAKDWDGRHQASQMGSAYSTMCWQADDKLAFLYEEETYGAGYTIVYKNYSIEQITDSAYTYNANVDRHAFVAESIDVKTQSITESKGYVGCIDPAAVGMLQESIEQYKAAPSKEGYEAINQMMTELPALELKANGWYRLRNAERQNATLYVVPEASRFTAGTSNDLANADQIFCFVESDKEGQYYLYNGNYDLYLGKLGQDETQPTVSSSTAEAGLWSVVASSNGQSQVVCNNYTGSKKGLHLAGDNQRLVPWYESGAPASLWYIEPVESFPVSINESGYATINLPFAVKMPAGVKAYAAVKEDVVEGVSCLVLEEVGENVNGPVVLAAEAGVYELPLAEAETTATENTNLLSGTLKQASLSEKVYLLNGAAFKKQTSSTFVAANTAYYKSANTAEELQLSLTEGDATGIESVSGQQQRVTFYSLDGRLVEKPTRGIYVTSQGKKVFVK
ncbi:MAG: exo-alpha-sialidase [Bacteroidaceae bacterium]|nr:exo-alpha-sialidase [Bacteroidaceae bacterium]